MDRVKFVRMQGLRIAAATALLGGCTSGDGDAARLSDSAALGGSGAPAEPAPAALPVQAESGSAIRTETSRSPTTPLAPPAATQPRRNTAPVLREPPPPRDTRPSIPYPPDTL